MREPAFSKAEENFAKTSIYEGARIDGRGHLELRNCSIEFGQEFGTCVASIGNTRALAHVSCSLDRPSEVRPSEGKIVFKVELPPLASPGFELNKKSPFAIDLNRLLEKAIVQSRCIDIEELCVRAGEQCWTLRVEVTALNSEGNLSDALCLAAMGALMHFKRPEVTVDGHDVVIHTGDEKEPTRLTLHHKPFCITIGYLEDDRKNTEEVQKVLILDPLRQEEQVLSGTISIAINKHREICAMRVSGNRELSSAQILSCTKIAANTVLKLQTLVENAIKKDDKERKKGRIPRVNCSVMDSYLGDLGEMADLLEQINKVKLEAKPDVEIVNEVDQKMDEEEDVDERVVVESIPVLPEVEVITPKMDSNWNEAEKWFDKEKEVFTKVNPMISQDLQPDESDEEEVLQVVNTEFK